MKNFNLSLLLFFIPCLGFAQSLNGVYTGVLSNDSTTIRKDQSFEMALTEYNGKVYGYAYSTFIVNDTLYYIVKRVKGKIEGDICEVEDDEVITHNFPHKPEKKVFVTYTLRRNTTDSVWRLDGNWKTNLVKKRFYSISGKVETKEEKDLSKSKLYEHLGDLDLQKTLAFNKPKETIPEKKPVTVKEDKNDIAKNAVKKEDKKNISPTETKQVDKNTDAPVAKSEAKAPDTKTTSTAVNSQTLVEKKGAITTNTGTLEKKSETNTVKADTKLMDNKTSSTAINNQSNPNEKKNVVATNSTPVDKKPEVPVAKPETKLPDNKPVVAVNNQPNQNEKKDVTATSTNPVEKPEVKSPDKNLASGPVNSLPSQNEKKDVARGDKKSTEDKADAAYEFQDVKRKRQLKPAASLVDQRVSIPSETIYFKNDSLSIALYDNGEVDGDSVSVIINDEMFIEKQVLKSTAFRKTFYIPQDQGDSLLVVLFADNLGKYPPNTGLLQIKDGEEIFYVRFKADLDRNAAIVLRRKSK